METTGVSDRECALKHPLSDWSEKAESSASSSLKKLTELPKSETVVEEVSIILLPEGQILNEHNAMHESRLESLESTKEEKTRTVKDVGSGEEESEDTRTHAFGSKEAMSLTRNCYVTTLNEKLVFLQAQSSKMSKEIKDLRSQGEMLKQELAGSALESHHLEIEHGLLKATTEMAINDQHPADFYIRELNKQLKPGSLNVLEQELDWHAFRKPPLGEKERSTKELHHLLNPEMQSNLQTLNEVELETEAIILEIRKREEEHSKLFGELEKQPRAATRKSYIQRVTEITKNSRKQDAGIEQILKDTRDLRLESNSIQERLHRTYVVADETMSRDVKKDLVRQQVYRLLTTMHESFGQIFEKISITDRIRREVVEQEAKLAAVSTSSLNIEKLQADLDKIRKENKLLEAAP